MDDGQIVGLYWARAEAAIWETSQKYGRYCQYIARSILGSREDSEECVNDTYMRAWNSMPPHRPSALKAFLGKITRNLSLDRYEKRSARKRGGGKIGFALVELGRCAGGLDENGDIADDMALGEAMNQFLMSLTTAQRKIFLRRYWYFSSIKEIAQEYGMSESRVKMSLLRSRDKLKLILEKEGISI